MAPTISLLHATYLRPGGPAEIREGWLRAAVQPDRVEYVVAMDGDDRVALASTEGWSPRIVTPPSRRVTAVRNWNAAAAAASGDLLVVVADDLYAPTGWDRHLCQLVERLDPTTDVFAVKLSDSLRPNDTLLRHPVVSRAYYSRFGLFWPTYTGVYCDSDMTLNAFWNAFIVDGRSLVLDHRHPTTHIDVRPTTSHGRVNDPAEYDRGVELMRQRWPGWQRRAPVRLVAAGVGPPRWLRLQRHLYRFEQHAKYLLHASRYRLRQVLSR